MQVRTCQRGVISLKLKCLSDLIIVLRAGSVAEQGTHEELLRQRGLYYEMWIQQADSITGLEPDTREVEEEKE